MNAKLRQLVESKWFQNTVRVAILLAGILVGLETEPFFADNYGSVLNVVNRVILGFFVLEIILKVGAEGSKPWRYFFDPWNVFDFVVVCAALLPFDTEYIAVLRLARLLRFLRLVRALPKLQVLVGALLRSIPSMMYVALLLSMLFYIYAVAGVFIFGDNDPVHFGNLPIAMLSLFRVATGEDWTDVMYIQMWGCNEYGYDDWADQCVAPESFPLFSPLFFVSFMLLGSLVVLNLFIGVIMASMDESTKEREALERLERSEADKVTLADGLRACNDGIVSLQSQIETLEIQARKLEQIQDRLITSKDGDSS